MHGDSDFCTNTPGPTEQTGSPHLRRTVCYAALTVCRLCSMFQTIDNHQRHWGQRLSGRALSPVRTQLTHGI
jgi:hypothetical protein